MTEGHHRKRSVVADRQVTIRRHLDDEILQLKAIAGDTLLVTTEKDFVRLSVTQREGIRAIKAVAVFDDPAGLDRLLDRAWAPV